MTELERLNFRIGEQRKEINRLKELSNRAVMCSECMHLAYHEQKPYCNRTFGMPVTEDGFCSYGIKHPTA